MKDKTKRAVGSKKKASRSPPQPPPRGWQQRILECALSFFIGIHVGMSACQNQSSWQFVDSLMAAEPTIQAQSSSANLDHAGMTSCEEQHRQWLISFMNQQKMPMISNDKTVDQENLIVTNTMVLDVILDAALHNISIIPHEKWLPAMTRAKERNNLLKQEVENFKLTCVDENDTRATDGQREEEVVKQTTIADASAADPTSTNTAETEAADFTATANPHPICQKLLPHPTPTAASLWHTYMEHVLYATSLPGDTKYKLRDFTSEILQMLSPRLVRSVKSLPQQRQWKSLQYAMDVLYERYTYAARKEQEKQGQKQQSEAGRPVTSTAKHNDSDVPPPRPLKILVMGGSVVVGTNCRSIFKEINLGGGIHVPRRDCTWSNRLDKFLNGMQSALFTMPSSIPPGANSTDQFHFGPFTLTQPDNLLVEVTKVAMGGTNTQTGSIIWEYDLIPPEARDPDIVINAYATNDMHILTMLEAQASNATLRDKVFDMTQDFVRTVLSTHDDGVCPVTNDEKQQQQQRADSNKGRPPPLLIHFNDYLGNEQRDIWGTTELSQGVDVLAKYYGFASMSYADTVRDIVYGDTHEAWLSANWWGRNRDGTYGREIHPGMGMHIASAWVTAYNLLNMVTTFCSLPQTEAEHSVETIDPRLPGLRRLLGFYDAPGNRPRQQPKGLPPRLTKELLIENVSQLWKEAETNRAQQCAQEAAQRRTGLPKCPFSWVSGLSQQQNNEKWVLEYFQSRASVWRGWQLEAEGGKTGFVPQKVTDEIVLDFELPQTIRTVTLFWMKSYGPKWQNSHVDVVVDGNAPRALVGYHAKNTSEMYTESVPVHIPANQPFRIQCKLVGGTTFKLMGMAVCS